MKKRATRKPSAANFLVSPPPTASPNRSPSESPRKQFEFELNLGAFNTVASSSKKRKKNDVESSSARIQDVGSPVNMKSLSKIADLKEMASSRLDSIKSRLDRSHSEIIKDLEASDSRLHKRFKIQTQACQQVVDEAEKEYKKISERITESREAMKASYLEFMAEAQASASRVCKTSIPELSSHTHLRKPLMSSETAMGFHQLQCDLPVVRPGFPSSNPPNSVSRSAEGIHVKEKILEIA